MKFLRTNAKGPKVRRGIAANKSRRMFGKGTLATLGLLTLGPLAGCANYEEKIIQRIKKLGKAEKFDEAEFTAITSLVIAHGVCESEYVDLVVEAIKDGRLSAEAIEYSDIDRAVNLYKWKIRDEIAKDDGTHKLDYFEASWALLKKINAPVEQKLKLLQGNLIKAGTLNIQRIGFNILMAFATIKKDLTPDQIYSFYGQYLNSSGNKDVEITRAVISDFVKFANSSRIQKSDAFEILSSTYHYNRDPRTRIAVLEAFGNLEYNPEFEKRANERESIIKRVFSTPDQAEGVIIAALKMAKKKWVNIDRYDLKNLIQLRRENVQHHILDYLEAWNKFSDVKLLEKIVETHSGTTAGTRAAQMILRMAKESRVLPLDPEVIEKCQKEIR